MIGPREIERRFGPVDPSKDPDLVTLHGEIRLMYQIIATALDAKTPDCREARLAVNSLEESLAWAEKAIDRHAVK